MGLREKIYDQVWNTYQEYKVLDNKEKSLPFGLFPFGITEYYKTLHELLSEYRKKDDFHIMDIASFFADLHMHKYLEGLHGITIVKTDMKIAFFNHEQLENARKVLIEIDNKNGIRRFQILGDDKIIIHLVNSQKEQLNILVDYQMLEPEPVITTYLYLIGYAYRFPTGYQIGSGELYHFNQLPKVVKESWRFWKTFSKYGKFEKIEKEKGYAVIVPENIPPEEVENYKDNSFIQIQIKSFGPFSEKKRAISTINRIVSIIRLFCSVRQDYAPFYEGELSTQWDYYFNNKPNVDIDAKSDISREQLGAVVFVNTKDFLIDFTRLPQFDKYISTINKIIEKDEIKRTDLETAIINTIDIYGTITANTNLNVNFLLCIIALESLLMGGKQENISYKLAERIALLIGDSEEWLQYCLFRKQINSISDKNSLTTTRIILNKIISDLYNKRSGFAHTGGKRGVISYDDYILAYRILRLVLMKIMVLYDSELGLLCREPDTRIPNKSLEEYIKGLKFGSVN